MDEINPMMPRKLGIYPLNNGDSEQGIKMTNIINESKLFLAEIY